MQNEIVETFNFALDAKCHRKFLDHQETLKKANKDLAKKNFSNMIHMKVMRQEMENKTRNLFELSQEICQEKEAAQKKLDEEAALQKEKERQAIFDHVQEKMVKSLDQAAGKTNQRIDDESRKVVNL